MYQKIILILHMTIYHHQKNNPLDASIQFKRFVIFLFILIYL